MAGLPTTEAARTLNTLVTSALDEYSGDPANFVNDGGFQIMSMLANNGRIFKVNDAERVEHPIRHGADAETQTRYVGDTFAGASNNFGHAQAEVLTKALFTMKNVTGNLNIPQALIDRPSRLAMSDVQYIVKRYMENIFEEEEMYLLRGEPTSGGTEAILTPFSGDADYSATAGSMSLLGLLSTGVNTATDKFGNIDTQAAGDGDARWAPQLFQATDAAPATDAELDLFLGDWEKAIRKTSRFGGIEKPTHGLITEGLNDLFVTALRKKTNINDSVVKDMGGSDVIPFRNVNFMWSQYLEKDTLWDITAETTAECPALLLNLNSLRLNLAHGGGVNEEGGFVKQMSELAPHPKESNFFSRTQYKYCYSLDNGRRSFAQIEGWTVAN
jgi:hypothetical protein